MNIILSGLPMCGKSTIGKIIAEKSKLDFIDTDRLIENAYVLQHAKQATCRQIFIEVGEERFRELETEQIAQLKNVEKSVIAVGGGALCSPENVSMLCLIGHLVYLKTPLNILWERMKMRGVAAYLDESQPEQSFYEIANMRAPIYEKAAKHVLDTRGLTKREVAAAVMTLSEKKHGK